MRVDGRIIKWDEVGRGGFNRTFVSQEPFNYEINGVMYCQHWVLKRPMRLASDQLARQMNNATRAVRVWNHLNPNHPAVEVPEQRGWIAPYLGNELATDFEIEQEQVHIYRKSRRVISDACGKNNFLFYKDEPVCIDVDLATHRESPVSKKILNELVELGIKDSVYEDYWSDYANQFHMPKSVQMTKTLLYLESQVAAEDLLDDYITPEVMGRLHHYQLHDIPIDKATLVSIVKDCQLARGTTASPVMRRSSPVFFQPEQEEITGQFQHDSVSNCVIS